MSIEITAMTDDDYDEVRRLWENSQGVGLDDSDSRENIQAYLRRNPSLSLVARDDGRIVGAVLCGHDGRRGYLSHLAVELPHQRRGVGALLVRTCLAKLADLGIGKCNARVYVDNSDGLKFWEAVGWARRHDVCVITTYTRA